MSYPTYDKSLKSLIAETKRVNQQNGWYERVVSIPEMIALIHSEASEALEAYRNNEPLSWTNESGKPEGIASEFADICIRVFHYCEALGIDLESEIIRKLAYNAKRGYRHGGKVI